jgi:protein-disulfide isomerase
MNSDDRIRSLFLVGLGSIGLLIVGGLVWAFVAGPGPVPLGSRGKEETGLHFIDDNDPAIGPGDAKVVVRMFEDLQCPSCQKAEPGIVYAMRKYSDRVRFVWNDFPLTSIHQNAKAAALAARCAEEQGKFWEFKSKLYDSKAHAIWSNLAAPTETFISYAKELGIQTDSFTTCIAKQNGVRKIQDDSAEAESNNVTATPTVFIGNVRYVGGMTETEWDQAILTQLPKS